MASVPNSNPSLNAEHLFLTKSEKSYLLTCKKNTSQNLPTYFTEFTQHLSAASSNRPTYATQLSIADAQTQFFDKSNKADDYTPKRNFFQRIRNLIQGNKKYAKGRRDTFNTFFDGYERHQHAQDYAKNFSREDESFYISAYHPTQRDISRAQKTLNSDRSLKELQQAREQKLKHSTLESILKAKKAASAIWKLRVGIGNWKLSLSDVTKKIWGYGKSTGAVQKEIIAHNFYQATQGKGRMRAYTETKRAHKHTFASRFIGKSISSSLKLASIGILIAGINMLPTNILIGSSVGVAILGRIFFAYKYHEERNREELRTREAGRPACSTLGGPPPEEALRQYLEFMHQNQQLQKQAKEAKNSFLQILRENNAYIDKDGFIYSSSRHSPLSQEQFETVKKALEIFQAMQRGAEYAKKLKNAKRWLKAELQCFAQLQAFSFFQNMANCGVALAAFCSTAGAVAGGPVAAAGIISGALLFAGVLPRTYANFFEQMNINNLREGNTRSAAFSEQDASEAAQFSYMVDLKRQEYNHRQQNPKNKNYLKKSSDYFKQQLISRSSEQNYFTIHDVYDDLKCKTYLKEWQKYSTSKSTAGICRTMRAVMHQKIDINMHELFKERRPQQQDATMTNPRDDIHQNISEHYLIKLNTINPEYIFKIAERLNLSTNSTNLISQIAAKLTKIRYQVLTVDELSDSLILDTTISDVKKQMPELTSILLNIDEYYTAICLQQLQPPTNILQLEESKNINQTTDQLKVALHDEIKRLDDMPFLKREQKELMIENLIVDFYQKYHALISIQGPEGKLNASQIWQKTLASLADTLNINGLNLNGQDNKSVTRKIQIASKISSRIFENKLKAGQPLQEIFATDDFMNAVESELGLNYETRVLCNNKIKNDRAHSIKRQIELDLHQLKEENKKQAGLNRKLIVLEDLWSDQAPQKMRKRYINLMWMEKNTLNNIYKGARDAVKKSRTNTSEALQSYHGMGEYLGNHALDDGDLILNQTADVLLSTLYEGGVLTHTNWGNQASQTDHTSERYETSETNAEVSLELRQSYQSTLERAERLHAQIHDVSAIKGTWQTQYNFRIKKTKQFLQYKFVNNLYTFGKESRRIATLLKKLDEVEANPETDANVRPMRDKLLSEGKALGAAFNQNQNQVILDLNLLIKKEEMIKDVITNSESGVLVFSEEEKSILNQKFENDILDASFYDENVAIELYNEMDKQTYGKIYEDMKGKFSATLPGILFGGGIAIAEANDWLGKDGGDKSSDAHSEHRGNAVALNIGYAIGETPLMWVPVAQGFARIADATVDPHLAAKKEYQEKEQKEVQTTASASKTLESSEPLDASEHQTIQEINWASSASATATANQEDSLTNFLITLGTHTEAILNPLLNSNNTAHQNQTNNDTPNLDEYFFRVAELYESLEKNNVTKSVNDIAKLAKANADRQISENQDRANRITAQTYNLSSASYSSADSSDINPEQEPLNPNSNQIKFQTSESLTELADFTKMQKLLGNRWFNQKLKMTAELLWDGFASIKRATYDQIKVTNVLHATRAQRREDDLSILRNKRLMRDHYREVYERQVAKANPTA